MLQRGERGRPGWLELLAREGSELVDGGPALAGVGGELRVGTEGLGCGEGVVVGESEVGCDVVVEGALEKGLLLVGHELEEVLLVGGGHWGCTRRFGRLLRAGGRGPGGLLWRLSRHLSELVMLRRASVGVSMQLRSECVVVESMQVMFTEATPVAGWVTAGRVRSIVMLLLWLLCDVVLMVIK